MSLAAQLQVLSGREKGKQPYVPKTASFLFDEAVAADTDSQTIYHLGYYRAPALPPVAFSPPLTPTTA